MLGIANAIDYAIQFVLPIVLVRSLDSAQFGEYRLLWLMVNTIMAFAPLYMPQSLFYFLPRVKVQTGRYVANVIWYLFLAGVIAACIAGPWNPLLPSTVRELPGGGDVILVFIIFWVASCLLEWLANAEGRVQAQSAIIITLAVLRALIVGGVAASTGDVWWVFVALAAFAGVKLAILFSQILTRYGITALIPDRNIAAVQIAYAVPFGIAGALYGLRQQADQWIVATLFKVEIFALFSIAGVVAPLAGLIRQSVASAILPEMNRMHGRGDLASVLSLNRMGNSLVALLLLPVLAFLFASAEDVIAVVYTPRFVDAADPMRVYLVGLAAQVLVVNNLLITLAQGRFQLRLNTAFLAISVVASLIGAHTFGITGAAAGSAIAQYGSHLASIRKVAHCTGVRYREILDWRTILHFFVISIFAALCGEIVVKVTAFTTPIARTLTSAATFALLWLPLIVSSSAGRELISIIRRRQK
ncbi:MAG: hypothetical protein ABIJ52_03695 [Pseudomonadota bacterium]